MNAFPMIEACAQHGAAVHLGRCRTEGCGTPCPEWEHLCATCAVKNEVGVL